MNLTTFCNPSSKRKKEKKREGVLTFNPAGLCKPSIKSIDTSSHSFSGIGRGCNRLAGDKRQILVLLAHIIAFSLHHFSCLCNRVKP